MLKLLNGHSIHSFSPFCHYGHKVYSNQIQAERQTRDRQTEKQTNIQTDKQADREIEKHTDRQADRQTDRQTDRQEDSYKHVMVPRFYT